MGLSSEFIAALLTLLAILVVVVSVFVHPAYALIGVLIYLIGSIVEKL